MPYRFKPFLIALLVALLGACASLPRNLERPTVDLVDLDVRELGLLEQRFLVTLKVQNPNNVAIPVEGLNYALQIGGQDFARGVSARSFTLPALGETRVQLEMSTTLFKTLRQLQDLLSGQPNKVSYKLVGDLTVDNALVGKLPFENSGELKLDFLGTAQ